MISLLHSMTSFYSADNTVCRSSLFHHLRPDKEVESTTCRVSGLKILCNGNTTCSFRQIFANFDRSMRADPNAGRAVLGKVL
jgi:hypothetical protein